MFSLVPWCKPHAQRSRIALVRSFYHPGVFSSSNSQNISFKVTRKNFRRALQRLKKQLHDADFIAVDLELSGVATAPWRRAHALDTCDAHYYKLKHSAENFTVWQFGVCPFKWTEIDQKFIAYPYSFHLFPRDELKLNRFQDKFLCQMDSLELLAKHGFDFNACVYHGISYLSKEHEAAARARIDSLVSESFPQRNKVGGLHTQILGKKQKKKSLSSLSHFQFSMEIKHKIREWLATLSLSSTGNTANVRLIENFKVDDCPKRVIQDRGGNNHNGGLNILKPCADSQFLSNEKGGMKCTTATAALGSTASRSSPSACPVFVFEKLRDYKVQVVIQVVNDEFIDLVPVVHTDPTVPDHRDVHVIYTASEGDKAQLMEELDQQERAEQKRQLEVAVGFRHVIDAIVASNKIVIGHDCLLDFAHIYAKFFAPLPSSIVVFAKRIKEIFPCNFDTKYIAKVHPQLKIHGSTQLSTLYKSVMKNDAQKRVRWKVEIAPELQNKASLPLGQVFGVGCEPELLSAVHEAGIDAYMSGSVFSYFCSSFDIEPQEIQHLPKLIESGMKTGLARHTNLLCWGLMSSDLFDLATGKCVTEVASTDSPGCNLALVWGFPYGISRAGLEAIINRALADPLMGCVEVSPVDDSSAFAKFKYIDALKKFIKLVQQPPSNSPDVAALVGCGIRAAKFAAYEKLCKSSLAMHRLSDCAEALKLGVYEQEPEDAVNVERGGEQNFISSRIS